MKTNQDKLTTIVQRGIDGDKDILEKLIRSKYTFIEDDIEIQRVNYGHGVSILYFRTQGVGTTYHSTPFTLPDLIADHEFMKMFGEETICPDCGAERRILENNQTGDKELAWCGTPACAHYVKVKIRYLYIQQQVIILPEQERVKYLYVTWEGK
jgi:hypothetical protein